jgi:hypothetical protein
MDLPLLSPISDFFLRKSVEVPQYDSKCGGFGFRALRGAGIGYCNHRVRAEALAPAYQFLNPSHILRVFMNPTLDDSESFPSSDCYVNLSRLTGIVGIGNVIIPRHNGIFSL